MSLPVDYTPIMRTKLLSVSSGIIFMFTAVVWLRADQLQMQNGERFSGKVLYVSVSTVVFESETLGKITLPRQKVAILAFGTNATVLAATSTIPRVSVPTNLPVLAVPGVPVKSNLDLSMALRSPGTDTNFIGQIRDQILAGSPAATAKYDEMVSGLLSGSLSMDDLRGQAKSSADQLRALKRDLGSDAGDALDGYLEVLDSFLKETDTAPSPPPLQSKVQVR